MNYSTNVLKCWHLHLRAHLPWRVVPGNASARLKPSYPKQDSEKVLHGPFLQQFFPSRRSILGSIAWTICPNYASIAFFALRCMQKELAQLLNILAQCARQSE
jgi:hypothetical protein